jgi:hypothetical protein
MTFNVEVVLKNKDEVAVEQIEIKHGSPDTWTEVAVRDVIVETLRAIERAKDPASPRDRVVTLTGFSWIVEPIDGQVMLALEIPMGVAAAGPFAMPQAKLDALVSSVMRLERVGPASNTVH